MTMNMVGKLAIVAVLATAVIAVVVMKKKTSTPSTQPGVTVVSVAINNTGPSSQSAVRAAGLPRLVDLGSTTCIPCKMMEPILKDLRREYAGRMQVDFIDVNSDEAAAKAFGIRLIPTQVFLDASGKELWRHEGFISKEDILAKWKELGVSFSGNPASGPTS